MEKEESEKKGRAKLLKGIDDNDDDDDGVNVQQKLKKEKKEKRKKVRKKEENIHSVVINIIAFCQKF